MSEEQEKALRHLATILMGEGRVDEGMLVEDLLSMTKGTLAKLSAEGPVCPTCREAMVRRTFKGYYESFSYWDCGCEDEVTGEIHKGAYT